ncbi:MAG: PrpR N-terminal domain-containing protein, partial [Eubacteriales bacterium]|nr:PrpR N-terminal domain-containing protein [Eubacteriales bacterium]
MTIRIGVLSHSQQFLNLMCTMVCDGVQIVTQNVNHLIAAESAKRMAPDVDIIIARERTATIIKEATSVPVVNCDFEMIDFLSTLSAQSLVGIGPIALIRESSRINRSLLALDMINKLFGYKISLITYTDQASLAQSFETAIAKGIRGIIGAGMAVEMAVNYGLRKVELITTPDTASAAFQKALLIAKSNQREKTNDQYLTSVLNAMNPAYILADTENRVRYINEFASEVTGLEIGSAVAGIEPPAVSKEQFARLTRGHTLQDILLHGKDTRRTLNCSLTPLFNEQKSYNGYLLQMRPTSSLPSTAAKRNASKEVRIDICIMECRETKTLFQEFLDCPVHTETSETAISPDSNTTHTLGIPVESRLDTLLAHGHIVRHKADVKQQGDRPICLFRQ